ncbi:MAG TPA: hypothetical protein VFI74_00510 [Candidatus Saccharimonadales bacterium]|nr:hypothetical protein [Candidatus Saccharimonadales bacterium]
MNQTNYPHSPLPGAYYNYQYIDHGAQFRVYSILTYDNRSTGRVVKVPLGFTESKEVLEPHLRILQLTEEEVDRRIHNLLHHKQQLPALLQGVYAHDKKLMRMLGDLRIVPRLAAIPYNQPDYFMPLFFTQNLVTPMKTFLHRYRFANLPPYQLELSDISAIEQVIQQVISLHYSLWEYGIFERSLKLENIGVTQHRKTYRGTLVDIGEITFNLNEAESILLERRWKNSLSPHKTDHLFIPTIMHRYYIDACNTHLTVDALRTRWRKRPLAIEQRQEIFLKIKEQLSRNKQQKIKHWMSRQALSSSLYRGIPQDRIDTLEIPRAELSMLLKDKRSGQEAQNIMHIHELRERQLYLEQRNSGTIQEVADFLFRQSLQANQYLD